MVEIKCFRCGAQPKLLMSLKIDETEVKMCPQCFADFGMFMDGRVIDRMICVKRDHYIRKKEEE